MSMQDFEIETGIQLESCSRDAWETGDERGENVENADWVQCEGVRSGWEWL